MLVFGIKDELIVCIQKKDFIPKEQLFLPFSM